MIPRRAYIKSFDAILPDSQVFESAEGIAYKKAVLPDFKAIIPDANMRRRLGTVVKMGTAAGLRCISKSGVKVPEEVGGIITATDVGCLKDTFKFGNSILDQNEQLLNPSPFIYSTFNTVGGCIALLLGIQAYNNTYVHRGLSFETALEDAALLIEEGSDNILVCTFEEIIPESLVLQHRLGFFREVPAGEGAAAFMLSGNSEGAIGRLLDLHTETLDGCFTDEDILGFLSDNNLQLSDVQIVDNRYPSIIGKIGGESLKLQFGDCLVSSSFALAKALELSGKILIINQSGKGDRSMVLVESYA